MWCWHRIREQESGLCPACRTEYGEDPHQFSAVDVEEVLKANKEKEAAAKRERQRQQEEEGSGAMEVPKDRSQLANMRVIRRNLVYAVGLPLAVATEETLRRPEYFGQYGKISKIVLNRAQAQAGTDPRRASASAYVTFVHKEDTLACILALDGFYLEGRNVRASYGTSKYCSAFIKNVRCNNPECTYLHEMGAAEDTFTKQEIQAGYVTSGRDVLARQQQILQEQLQQGQTGGPPRKKTGGGGPSGTGKACTNPVFPVPEYDEPAKPAPALVPAPTGVARTSATAVTLNPANISAKLGRSSSVGAGGRSPVQGSVVAPVSLASHRKTQSTGVPQPGTTAAAVVASGRSTKQETNEVTLTPLTPLKRATKSASQRSASFGAAPSGDGSTDKAGVLRNGSKKIGIRAASAADAPAMPTQNSGVGSIGGDVIGPPTLKPRATNGLSILGGDPVGPSIDSFGSHPFSDPDARSSSLGGDIFTGQLPNGPKSTIGGLGDKWNSGQVGGPSLTTGPMLSGSSDAFWNGSGSGSSSSLASGPSSIGGDVIGGSRASGLSSSNANGNSTSALASILGISLPTGSGSLRDPSLGSMWSGAPTNSNPSPLASLNSSAIPTQDFLGGQRMGNGGSSLIGGVPIGGAPVGAPSVNTKNDIALLQSLLPGVHITSGGDTFHSGVGGHSIGMNGGGVPIGGLPPHQSHGMGPSHLNGDTMGGNWNGGFPASPGQPVGAIGQNVSPQNQRRGPGIW